MFFTLTWILSRYISCNSSQSSKVFERYGMSLFSSRFYNYLTKYIKFVAQKKQLTRILEILGKFRPLLLKRWAFSRKIGVVMLMYNIKFLGDWLKRFEAKVVGKGFLQFVRIWLEVLQQFRRLFRACETLYRKCKMECVDCLKYMKR